MELVVSYLSTKDLVTWGMPFSKGFATDDIIETSGPTKHSVVRVLVNRRKEQDYLVSESLLVFANLLPFVAM